MVIVSDATLLITEAVTDALTGQIKHEDPDQIMRRKDVAREFKVSIKTIAIWMKSEKIPYHKFGSRVFIKRSEILEVLRFALKSRRT